jgi:acyl-coenzyme A synthetase/AMP-(fatty) acid ligase
VRIRWFDDGILNVAANCIDRHLPARAEQVALIWEPDDPADAPLMITYRALHERVCRLANVTAAEENSATFVPDANELKAGRCILWSSMRVCDERVMLMG